MMMENEKGDILSLDFLVQVVDVPSQDPLCAITRKASLRKHLQQDTQDLLHRDQRSQQRQEGE
jgi:hypothetical protein